MLKVVRLAAAAGVLAFSAGLAEAYPARVLKSTNLRQGPGTTYGVTATVPGGSIVEISGCATEWCTAHWAGKIGYMIATNLAPAGPGPAGPGVPPPAVVYVDPPIVYGPPYGGYYGYYGYGPRYYWGRRRW